MEPTLDKSIPLEDVVFSQCLMASAESSRDKSYLTPYANLFIYLQIF